MGKNKDEGEINARLGRIAQKRLGLALEYSGLTATSPSPDLNGLDFVVEQIPKNALAGAGFDRRPEHAKLEIQLKGTAKDKPQVSIALSRLAILVESTRPAAIAVMHFDDADSPEPVVKGFYLVHLIGKRLASALKALRRNGLSGKIVPNDAHFSLTAHKSEEVQLDAAGLLAAFLAICGPSMREYGRTKQHQHATLGYPDEGRHAFRGQVSASIGDVVDGFLGLRPLAVDLVEHWETRFGLPERVGVGRASISIITPRSTLGSLLVKRSGKRLRLDAELRTHPFQVSAEHDKSVIRTLGLEFIRGRRNWSMRSIEPEPELSAFQWAQEMGFAELICRGNAALSFESEAAAGPSWTVVRPESANLIEEVVAKRELLEAIARIETAAAITGVSLDTKRILGQQNNIRALDGVMRGEFPMRIDWEMDHDWDDGVSSSMIAVRTRINRRLVGFAFRLSLSFADGRWYGRSDESLDASVLPDDTPEAFERFYERIKKLTGIGTVVSLHTTENDGSGQLFGSFGEPRDHLEMRFYDKDD